MKESLIIELAGLLKPYLSIDLNEPFRRVAYAFPDLSAHKLSVLERLNYFERQVQLKDYAKEILKGSFEQWDKDKWIVHTWGGIHKFNVGNHQRIREFRDSLVIGETAHFNRISSLSKIASFVKPEQFFVYDSRVAFALNGLLLECIEKDDEVRFFPLPSAIGGRDRQMKDIIATRIQAPSYYSEQDAYIVYNQLILELFSRLFPDSKGKKPCQIEMLLFELGKTNGIIAQRLGIVTKNQKKGKTSPSKKKTAKNGISALKRGDIILTREVRKGYQIVHDGSVLYLFVGEDKRKSYCEVLSKEGQYKDEARLVEKGFEKRGGSHPYFIKEYGIDDINSAISFMDGEVKSLLEKLYL